MSTDGCVMKVRLLGHYQPATTRQLATYHEVEQVNDRDFSSGLRDADVFVARNHVNINAVAEHALALPQCAWRRAPLKTRQLRAGKWSIRMRDRRLRPPVQKPALTVDESLWCARRAFAFLANSMAYSSSLDRKVHFDPNGSPSAFCAMPSDRRSAVGSPRRRPLTFH